ncbi:hypothetical protein OE88DRAFT_1643873 [Heliocybe sulcata]|uniref:Uncharacterized protein n=1 Tax=Heliocybe sulcata TaxID=5364 RepID=A0A5C3N8R2_9AGAM|nr:hypothetical protein OE88DRAFT_1643873 [Heliocybe sulcata]
MFLLSNKSKPTSQDPSDLLCDRVFLPRALFGQHRTCEEVDAPCVHEPSSHCFAREVDDPNFISPAMELWVMEPHVYEKNSMLSTKRKCECHHRENLHALEEYLNDLGRLLPEKASDGQARQEACAGFRKLSQVGESWLGKAAEKVMGKVVRGVTRFKVAKAPKLTHPIRIRRVILLPYGIKWSSKAIDNWLCNLLPNPFEYLDAHYGIPEEGVYHWKLCIKSRKKLAVVERTGKYTGQDMFVVRGGPGKNSDNYAVYFTTVNHIPKLVYTNWAIALSQAQEGLPEVIGAGEDPGDPTTAEEASSDSEEEGSSHLLYKGKSVARRKERLFVESDVEGSESSESSTSGKEGHGSDGGERSEALVEGSGLAGCKSAHLLRKRKWSYVEVSDGEDIAGGWDAEFVQGTSTKRLQLDNNNSNGAGSHANPFDIDSDFNAYAGTTNDFFLFPTASNITQPSASGSGSGLSTSKFTMPSPGKLCTNPWA